MDNDINVYTQAGCMRCKMVKQVLDSEGITYNEVYLETEEEKEDFRSKGYMSTPVTIAGDKEILGFDPEALKALK